MVIFLKSWWKEGFKNVGDFLESYTKAFFFKEKKAKILIKVGRRELCWGWTDNSFIYYRSVWWLQFSVLLCIQEKKKIAFQMYLEKKDTKYT